MIYEQQVIPVIADRETWRLLYRFGDPVLIVSICLITQQVKSILGPKLAQWVPLVPLMLGFAAALAVQAASPYDLKWFVIWRRMITYAGGAALAWSTRKLWMPGAVLDENAQGARE